MKRRWIICFFALFLIFTGKGLLYGLESKLITIETRGYIHSSPLLYDINQDGFKEIIVGDMAGYVYCFNYRGEKLWEYYAGDAFDKTISPVPEWFNPEVHLNNDLGNINIQSACAAGDLDGDGKAEIICGVGGFVDPKEAGGAGGTTSGFGPVGQGGILILSNEGNLKLLIRGLDTMDGRETPIQDGYSDGFYSTPAVGDIDKDGKLDFVIGGVDMNIYAFKIIEQDNSKNASGKTIRFFHPPGKDGFWPVPIFEKDDDGDGKFNEDPVGKCTPFIFYDIQKKIDAGIVVSGYKGVDDDGDGLIDEGFWSDDDEDGTSQHYSLDVDWSKVDEDEFEWPFRSTDATVSSPALADVEGKGFLNIIIGGSYNGNPPLKKGRKDLSDKGRGGILRVMDWQSNEVGDFPQWVEQIIFSSPSIADIDNDGQMEVFVGTGPYTKNGDQFIGRALYAFRSNGVAYLSGTSPYGLFAETQDVIWGAPAFGDINGDGNLEVVAADFAGYVYAWDRYGNLLPGFPLQPLRDAGYPGDVNPQIRSSPILVDVDGDNLPEIVIGVGFQIIAIKGDGSIVPEFVYPNQPIPGAYGCALVHATPAAADLDNNGKIDLVWATGHSDDCHGNVITKGLIHIWELGTFNPQANPWPMFKRTGTRTSAYTLQFENPIFDPPPSQVKPGDSWRVSIQVYQGKSLLNSVHFHVEINGSSNEFTMVDDGTNGDSVAGDGRYTATIQLPAPIGTIGNIFFSAQASDSESAELKVSTPFLEIMRIIHLNITNSVTGYYLSVLDRPPDLAGEEGWTSEIERIVSLGIDIKEGFLALARFFFNAEEYIGLNKDNNQFVTDLYQTFLNRAPDPGGLAGWVDYLNQGITRNMLITEFAYSNEFMLYIESVFGSGTSRPENNLVNDLYRGFLNRFPDDGGFNGWLGLMRNAQCAGSPQQIKDLSYQIALGFVQSAEYGLRNRTNSEYVEDLYNGILRRSGDPGGFTGWVGFLNNHTYTREQVLQFFVNSPEFQSRVQEVINAGCFQ